MSTGERDTKKNDYQGINKETSHPICPKCGKRAIIRFLNEKKDMWLYKHVKRTGGVDHVGRSYFSSSYCEAKL